MAADDRRTVKGPDDWTRYGGARDRDPESEIEELRADDPFADYRRESRLSLGREQEPERAGLRTRANLLGAIIALVALIGGAGVANIAIPKPSPPTLSPRPYPSFSFESMRPVPTLRMARVLVVVPLPISIFVPERSLSPDDGRTMYLAGRAGGFSVDVGAGRVGTVWGGSAFPRNLRKLLFAQGLWASTWPSNSELCGPDCWDSATTYRIDPASGAITSTLRGTYLVGATFEGVYVATEGSLRIVDPGDGHELSATPWKVAGEPRLGCDSIWSVQRGDRTVVDLIGEGGNRIGGTTLDSSLTFGPVSVEGFCWMMSGRDGASAGKTSLVWLSPSGDRSGDRKYDSSIVVLNGEFWLLRDDATIQRFEAASAGLGYGPRFKLPVTIEGGDPRGIFSSVNTVWVYWGSSLMGLDILTGSAYQAS